MYISKQKFWLNSLVQSVFEKNKGNNFEKNIKKYPEDWKTYCYQEYHVTIYLDTLFISFNIINITLILF